MLHFRQREWEKTVSIADGLYGDWKSGDISKEEYGRLKQKYSLQAKEQKKVIQNIQAEYELIGKTIL